MEIAALVISILSAALAGLAWWQNRRQAIASVDMVAIEKRRDEGAANAAASAALTISSTVTGMDGVLEVRNVGQSVARAFRLQSEPPIGEPGPQLLFDFWPFPCDIHPGQVLRLGFTKMAGSADRLQTSMRWTDATGERETLSIVALT